MRGKPGEASTWLGEERVEGPALLKGGSESLLKFRDKTGCSF